MYQYIGQKTTETEKTVSKDDGYTYLVNGGYYLPHYKPGDDPLQEKSDYLERFFQRFLNHCEPVINIKRNDAQIAQLRQNYEALPDEDPKKRMAGALLVGAIVRRCGKICKKIIKEQRAGAEVEDDFSSLDGEGHEAAMDDAVSVAELAPTKQLRHYILYLTENPKLMGCPRLRNNEGYIAVDSSHILMEAFSEITKTALSNKNQFFFYENRAGKLSGAMRDIDVLTKGMEDMVAEARNNEALTNALQKYGQASKVRAAIRSSDVENYEEAAIAYDVAKEHLSKTFLSNTKHDIADHYMDTVEGMVELRQPLPKSVDRVRGEIKSAMDWVLGKLQG